MNVKANLIHMLLVEDDDDHAFLINRNLKSNRIINTVDRVKDGQEALDYLYMRGEFAESGARPDIILLDLKLPKVDGHEVLKIIKSDPSLHSIPVVVLTTSESESDRAKAYMHNANSYVVKPISSNGFQAMVHDLSLYWGVVNVGPPE